MKSSTISNNLSAWTLIGTASVMLLFASSVRADYESTVLSDNPVVFYPLDLTVDTGGTATDISTNGLTATFNNIGYPYNLVSGPSAYITNAASLNGNAEVDLPNSPLLYFSGPITLEAWVQPSGNNASPQDIIAKGYATNYDEIQLRQYSDFYQSGDANGYVSGPAAVGGWSHVVSTYDGTNWRIYVNGQLAQTGASSGPVQFDDTWAIGNGTDQGNQRFFTGNICEVAIYNTALPQAQIKMHYWIGNYGTTNFSPIINQEPQANVTLYSGGTANFGVSVDSALSVNYQWYKGAAPLSSQTNATLILTNVQASDSGNYSVTISNTTGSTNSTTSSLTVVAPGAYGALVMNDKPVAYYPLNETAGTSVFDYADGYNGTYQNGPILGASGPNAYITNGVTFSGTSGQIADLGNPAGMNLSGLVSLEAWVQAGNNGNGYIVAHGLNLSPTIETELKAISGAFDIAEYGVYYKDAAAPYQPGDISGNWVHLVGTWDGTNWNIYRNGVLAGSTPSPGGIVPLSNCDWAIGGSSTIGYGGRNFIGTISQVAIYNYALTPSQVQAHYHMGLLGTTNPPPSITSDLTDHSIYTGGTLHLGVGVDSALPVAYSWYKGSSSLSGRTNSMFALTNIQSGDAGSYHVVVSSQAGSVTSAVSTVTIFTPPGQYSSLVMDDQPFAYYPLSETSGTNAVDYAGGFDGAYESSPILGASGPSTNLTAGVTFTAASSQYVDLSKYASMMNFGGPIAMEAWVQPAPSSIGVGANYDIIAKGWVQNPVYSEIVLRADGNTFAGGDANGLVSTPETSGWTHLVSSYDGTNWTLYANGALVGKLKNSSGVAPFNAPWAIANGTVLGAGRYFDGTISQVALYQHALNASQVAAHYQMGLYGTYLPPQVSSQPATNTLIYAGGTLSLNVSVVSAYPVSYIWYKGASPLSGQTNSTLILSNVQTTDSGTYYVAITNQLGGINSTIANVSVVSGGVYGAAVAGDQPLAFYPLNESSGTVASDYSGNGLNGMYVNSPQLATAGPSSYLANAVTFDGSSQNVAFSNQPLLNFSGKITMEAWVKPSSSSVWGDILAKGYDANNGDAELVLRANGGNYYAAGNGDVGSPGGSETANWTYVVAYNDGTNWNMYINGALVASNPNSGGSRNLAYPWAIATGTLDGANRYFNGAICNVAIYNYALTPNQVAGHYQIGTTGAYAAPTISSQPQTNIFVYLGGSARMTIQVSSAIPVSYVWYKGSNPLSGQTNATLVLNNTQLGDTGSYHVIATSDAGSVSSSNSMVTVLTPGLYSSAIESDAPLAYYPLNETSGSVAFDYSGNGLNGAYSNPQLAVSGPTAYVTNAVNFNGNAQVGLPNSPLLNFAGPITLEAWVQPSGNNASPQDIIAKGYDSSYNEIFFRQYSTSYQSGVGNNYVAGSATVGTWSYVVVTCDGTNWRMYVNGVLTQTQAFASPVKFNDAWAIGNGTDQGNQRFFNGKICEVALYNKALTPVQIQAHYNTGVNGFGSSAPKVNAAVNTSAGLVISGTGPSNVGYTVLTTTNLASPIIWNVAGAGTCNNDGTFNYTNSVDPDTKQQFLKIKFQ